MDSFSGADDAELWASFPDASTSGLKRQMDSYTDMPRKKLRSSEKLRLLAATAQKLRGNGPIIIAGFEDFDHHKSFQSIGLATGVQWEVARLASMGRVRDVSLEDLERLKGSNAAAAPRTAGTLLNAGDRQIKFDVALSLERKAQDPWAELDLEESAISSNPSAGLGNSCEHPGFYGGKVCFSGSIEVMASKEIKVILERCFLATSCRLYRQFGSSSFLRLRIPSKTLHSNLEGLREFFQRPFVLFDSVFRSFYAKDGTVLLYKTRERSRDGVIETIDRPRSLMLFEFLDQFNPLHLNSNQLLCKWASRFALGLSNSVPGPILPVDQVDEYEDIFSATRSNMTDGCGLSNPAFNLELRKLFKLDHTPCAVQIRHGGKKGMLLLSPESYEDLNPRIAFRTPSQVKIVYSDAAKNSPANSTVDVLRFSKTKTPARLSVEVIINLEHNGVPAQVFEAMQDEYLASGVEGLMFWAKEIPENDKRHDDMFRLWAEVERAEGVSLARRARHVGGEARLHGLADRYGDAEPDEDEEESEKFDKALHERSTAWWPDYISGQPSSLAETAMTLIDSGFTPQNLPVLREKIKQIVKTKIKYRATHFNYEVTQSASAFVVPDFWRVLEKDEIHFKSSRREFPLDDGVETDIILGTVLMTRNPCKVPTDVRKLRAVKHPLLHDLVDVIVCSAKGSRRLLDFLAGGDYDGDRAIVIWDNKIVDPFINAPEEYSNEPEELDKCFTRDQTTVRQFILDNERTSAEIKAKNLQSYLLGSLRDSSAVGQYSVLHDNSIISKGYDHPQTVALAYKFCKILDSPKTGYTIKPAVRLADQKAHQHACGPAWKSRQQKASNDRKFVDTSNAYPLSRNVDLANPMLSRPYIMDVLNAAAVRQEDQWLAEVEQLFLPFETSHALVLDEDLTAPWDKFAAFAAKKKKDGDSRAHNDLTVIVKHVEEMYKRHRSEIKDIGSWQRNNKSSSSFTGNKIEVRQDTFRMLSRDFAAAPTVDQLSTIFDVTLISRLRASYAYLYDYQQYKGSKGWSRFPWDMSLKDLCQIKATALGVNKSVTVSFYERFNLMRQHNTRR